MPSVIERASSGRAKCRACGVTIARGEERFGEALPNAYGEGEALFWFHLPCAASARPESFLPLLSQHSGDLPERAALIALAEEGIEKPRLCRIVRAEHAPSGRARCRHCREVIEQGALRIALQIFEEGRFTPIGTIHAGCAAHYFEVEPSLERLKSASNALADEELREVLHLVREGAKRAPAMPGLAKASADELEGESSRKSS